MVLPFKNLSGDPSEDYFADGITENLTTDLSRIRNSFVIANSTANTYKGKAIDAREIGKDLGVRFVLDGSSSPTLCARPSLTRSNRRGTDPYARWCGRGGAARHPPIPITGRYRTCSR